MHWFDRLADSAAQPHDGHFDRRTSFKLAAATGLALGPMRGLLEAREAHAAPKPHCYVDCTDDLAARVDKALGRCAKRRDRAWGKRRGTVAWYSKALSDFDRCSDKVMDKADKQEAKCREPDCGDRKKYPPLIPPGPPATSPNPLPPPPPPPPGTVDPCAPCAQVGGKCCFGPDPDELCACANPAYECSRYGC